MAAVFQNHNYPHRLVTTYECCWLLVEQAAAAEELTLLLWTFEGRRGRQRQNNSDYEDEEQVLICIIIINRRTHNIKGVVFATTQHRHWTFGWGDKLTFRAQGVLWRHLRKTSYLIREFTILEGFTVETTFRDLLWCKNFTFYCFAFKTIWLKVCILFCIFVLE